MREMFKNKRGEVDEKEKGKSNREATCTHTFSMAIIGAITLSVCVGIVAVENGSLSMNAGAAVTDAQECFVGNTPFDFEIKMPQSKERLRVAERRMVSAPSDGGEDIPFPIVSQNKNGLRVFSYIHNATMSDLGVINASQSNESRDIGILKGAQNETSIEIHKIKEKDMTIANRKIAEDLKPKSGYKASKVPYSKLTSQPIMLTSSMEEPSSNLTIAILNKTTASVEWLTYVPGKYALYIPFYKDQMENNIEDVEKGIEDLFLQDVEDIRITWGDETLLITFDLKGNYTNSFVTGKYRYTYELSQYAPAGISILKIVIPQNKTLVSVNPGPNEIEGNELVYYDYNWIYPLDIHYAEKTLAGMTKASIGEEWELPKLTSSADILGGEKALGEIPTNEYSRFAEPYLWVGTGGDPVPGTSKTAYQVAEDYKPWLYNRTDQCPDRVYYRVVKGYDAYSGFDTYLFSTQQNTKSKIFYIE